MISKRRVINPADLVVMMTHCMLWQQGRRLFLDGAYFEAHEAWEALWLTLPKVSVATELVQAFIQCCAVGLHIQQGNLRGVQLKYMKLYRRLNRLSCIDWQAHADRFPLFSGEVWQQSFASKQVPDTLAEAQALLKVWHTCF